MKVGSPGQLAFTSRKLNTEIQNYQKDLKLGAQDTAFTLHGCPPEQIKFLASNLTGAGKSGSRSKASPQKKVYDINDQVKVVAKWWKELQLDDLQD